MRVLGVLLCRLTFEDVQTVPEVLHKLDLAVERELALLHAVFGPIHDAIVQLNREVVDQWGTGIGDDHANGTGVLAGRLQHDLETYDGRSAIEN